MSSQGKAERTPGPSPTEFDDYEPVANLAALLMLADYSRYVFWLCAVGIVLCLQWYALNIFISNFGN
jgi:hypothetical protein